MAATKKLKLGAKDAAARATQLIAGFDTFGYSLHAVRAALEEAPKGRFSYWDGVLLASAAEAGCTTLFSEDMADGARFGSIVVANPFWEDGLAPHASDVKRGDSGMDMSIGARSGFVSLNSQGPARRNARHRQGRPVSGDRCRNIGWSNPAEKANDINSARF